MKSNYSCVQMLKYSVFFDKKNVYCVGIAKRKKKKKRNLPLAEWHFNFYKVYLCQMCKDLIYCFKEP